MLTNDKEKTAFTTDRRIYCYKLMPFRLKNTSATYQLLVNEMFVVDFLYIITKILINFLYEFMKLVMEK